MPCLWAYVVFEPLGLLARGNNQTVLRTEKQEFCSSHKMILTSRPPIGGRVILLKSKAPYRGLEVNPENLLYLFELLLNSFELWVEFF
jgi:hypothetical protein